MRVLFVAPAVPAPTGSGLRMRGYLFLSALARDHRVTLVAGSRPFPDETEESLTAVRDMVEEAIILPFRPARDAGLLWRRFRAALGLDGCPDWAEPTAGMRRRMKGIENRKFDRTHVFRLYMLPLALSLPASRSRPFDIDLDDWESETRRSQGGAREAGIWAGLESGWLPRADRVFVCSAQDQSQIRERYSLKRVEVVPNAVRVPAALPPRPQEDPPHLLFIGSLGHAPNQEAVRFLVEEVLPACLTRGVSRFRLIVAGRGAPRSLVSLMSARKDVDFIESPRDVEPLYARAALALAPIRSGGGTRIKALEAFAQGRPLIATAAAMAGLEVEPRTHYWPAETGREWVDAIDLLLSDAGPADRIAASAFAWVRDHDFESAVDKVRTRDHERE